jgi:acetyltransferase-like isoleucine patch superfamily enzyme
VAYHTQEALEAMGFKHLGKDVKISDKASIYDAHRISLDDYARIDDFCVVSGSVSLGKYVHITVFCNLAGGEKGIVIEDFSTVAYGCHIFTQSDDYSGESMVNSNIPKKYKNEIKAAIHIEKHVIIGAGSYILPGVTLKEGTSIGAKSLLLKTTQAWSIYAGSPAKRLKARSKKILELEKEFLSEQGVL